MSTLAQQIVESILERAPLSPRRGASTQAPNTTHNDDLQACDATVPNDVAILNATLGAQTLAHDIYAHFYDG
jgi:hypothetical protein